MKTGWKLFYLIMELLCWGGMMLSLYHKNIGYATYFAVLMIAFKIDGND